MCELLGLGVGIAVKIFYEVFVHGAFSGKKEVYSIDFVQQIYLFYT